VGLFDVVVSVIISGDDEWWFVVFLLGQFLLIDCDDGRSGYMEVFEMLV
jgi:hypothetical protein